MLMVKLTAKIMKQFIFIIIFACISDIFTIETSYILLRQVSLVNNKLIRTWVKYSVKLLLGLKNRMAQNYCYVLRLYFHRC